MVMCYWYPGIHSNPLDKFSIMRIGREIGTSMVSMHDVYYNLQYAYIPILESEDLKVSADQLAQSTLICGL